MPSDVVCAGIIVVDHVAAPIDHMPNAGELVLTDECFLSIGGCASNVAVDLAKQSISVNVSGLVGDDSFGGFARDFLQAAAIDVSGLRVAKRTATSQTLIVNVIGQDRRFIHHLGANRLFSAEHFPRESIANAKLLYVGGYFLMESLKPADLARVFAEARQAGVKTMLDVVIPGPGNYMEALATILPETDYFHANDDEGRAMTGHKEAAEQAAIFAAAGAGVAIVTLGGAGAVLVSRRHRLRAGAFDVNFVDGTGGGDAFDAGWIRGVLEGGDDERCLALGSALGASCVRQSGATAGVFTADQLDDFLEAHKLRIESF